MKGYGLIGFPLTHSFSKQFFIQKFNRESLSDCYYENFPIQSIDRLHDLIAGKPELSGFNVTIPYKEKILPLLDDQDDESREIGAVNTVKIYRTEKTYRMKGFNTDAYGFEASILTFLRPSHRRALILGTGGASKAAAFVLKNHNFRITFVSRHPSEQNQISYKDLSAGIISEFQIIVNASPAGMFPDTGSFPDIPYHALNSGHILYDLVYNPSVTKFMEKGKAMGATVINGMDMLRLQAERAWEIWNDPEL
ncbi:MAG: shikimate dehydrogenase [Bacteroidales bacterium]|nr:shikimate dehydrogenase [Bacteroidales bacterium]